MNKNKESLNSISSGDEVETNPDEEYNSNLSNKNSKSKTWEKQKNGPNINLKCFKKHYNSKEEKHFIHEKIKIKKKLNYAKIGNYIMIVILKTNVLLLMVLKS